MGEQNASFSFDKLKRSRLVSDEGPSELPPPPFQDLINSITPVKHKSKKGIATSFTLAKKKLYLEQ